MLNSYAIKTILIGSLLLTYVGCADPMFHTRPVQDEPSLFVGLGTYRDTGKLPPGQHNHPWEWSETDLRTILTRLLIQKQGGMMDPLSQPQIIFSPHEIIQLTPALRKTFQVATPSDWVVFAVWGSSPQSQALEVTSGGMFLENQRLHIILANHRERVSSEQDGIKGIRRNPFRSLRDIKKGKLLFDPARYMINSQDKWMAGGFKTPASELTLDLQAILATPPGKKGHSATEDFSSKLPSAPLTHSSEEVGVLKEEISILKEEMTRLKRRVNQQGKESSPSTKP